MQLHTAQEPEIPQRMRPDLSIPIRGKTSSSIRGDSWDAANPNCLAIAAERFYPASMLANRRPSIAQGFVLPIQAGQLLWRLPRVKAVAWLPVLVNFVVYLAVLGTAFWFLWNWDWSLLGQPWQFWGGFGAWLQNALHTALNVVKWMLAVPVLLVICYFTFSAVGMIVASPFNDLLSERIETAICEPQNRPRLSWPDQARMILISVCDSLAILLRQVFWMVLALPFLLIPYVGFLPLFLVTAYHTGLGFVDVAMARNYLRNAHKRLFIRQHQRQLLGIGLAMELMFLIPFLGLFILPLGVAAGTLLYCRYDWETAFRNTRPPLPARFVPPKLLAEPNILVSPGQLS